VLTARLEDDAGVLLPLRMFEPPTPQIHGALAHHDVAIEIEISEILEPQERRHMVDIVLAASIVLDLLEPQHSGAGTVEHDAVLGVHLGEHVLCRWRDFLKGQLDPRVANQLVEGDGSHLKFFGKGQTFAVVVNV